MYRDSRTDGVMEEVFAIAGGRENVFNQTGTQFMQINSLFQVMALAERSPSTAALTIPPA